MAPKKLMPRSKHTDIVEQHIISFLEKLQYQNKRLQTYIKKTGSWTHMKRIEEWKPFDFFNYFCTKFQEKYRKQYRMPGSLVRAYQRIEDFIIKNNIPKKDYKQFIELSFDRYFNGVNTPHIAHICSIDLYEHLMNQTVARNSHSIHQLDIQLAQENEKFDEYMKRHNLYNYNASAKTHASV